MRDVLLRLLASAFRALRPATDAAHPRCVLLLQYMMPLGCCVHGTPVYAALKAGDPDLLVVVATRSVGAATLAHDPHVDAILETPDPMASVGSLWRTILSIRRQLRERGLRPQWVLQDGSNMRGRYAFFAAALRLAPTMGFAGVPLLYDVPLQYDKSLSLIDNCLRLPQTLFGTGQHREPGVYFTASELEKAHVLLSPEEPSAASEVPVIAFAVRGSGGQPTAWLPERFAEVIRHVEGLGCRTVVVGTPADAADIQQILDAANSPGLNLAGKTSIAELAALLCLCDLMVSIDTGAMHVGRSAEVPLVVLATCWQHPIEWLPLRSPNASILRSETVYEVPPNYQMDELEVPAVTGAIDELLRLFPPAQAARERRAGRLLSSARP